MKQRPRQPRPGGQGQGHAVPPSPPPTRTAVEQQQADLAYAELTKRVGRLGRSIVTAESLMRARVRFASAIQKNGDAGYAEAAMLIEQNHADEIQLEIARESLADMKAVIAAEDAHRAGMGTGTGVAS